MDVIEYSLSRSLSQTMIAEYKTKLIDKSILLRKLAELYDIAEENDNLKPTDVVCGSNKVVYWECDKCGFQWKLSGIKNIKRKKKCKNCGV